MAAKWIAEFGLRIAQRRTAVIGTTLLGLFVSVVWADSYAERAATVKSLSTDKKAELLRKKQRFDELKDAEKQRLRDLDAQLSAEPNATELKNLMSRYCNWLKNLSSRDRDQVLSLPAEERIKRIKDLVSRQEAQRLREYVTFHLPKADQEAIYKFLDDFVAQHEQEILDRLDETERRWARRIDDDRARRKALIPKLARRRGDSRMPFPSVDEMRRMVSSVSKETQMRLESPAGTDQDDRVRELVGAAIMSIALPPPTEDDLRKLFASLPSDEKGRLEEMDSEKMQQALRFMYRSKQMQGGGRGGMWGGWRGDGPRRDDDRDGPRGPRPVGPPPPGFASPK